MPHERGSSSLGIYGHIAPPSNNYLWVSDGFDWTVWAHENLVDKRKNKFLEKRKRVEINDFGKQQIVSSYMDGLLEGAVAEFDL